MREIILDTETTGLDPRSGDRIVEIGGVEMIDGIPTGNDYQQYINPERTMPEGAFKVHGISDEFLENKPVFADIAQEFIDYIGDARLVIHNAKFDIGFLQHEIKQWQKGKMLSNEIFCTLEEARRRFPGQKNNLDALCKRLDVDNSARTAHGALLDSQILAEVYIELMGGKQSNLSLKNDDNDETTQKVAKTAIPARAFPPSEEEVANHQEFIKPIQGNLW